MRGFFTTVKYVMQYSLYTTVDITHTGQYRDEPGKEADRWKEQNFQTVLQVLGMRANVIYSRPPSFMKISGKVVGFNTSKIIHAWYFEFSTERDYLYETNNDPVGYLKEDFNNVPYISGLDESMDQNYDVFVTDGPARNIVFHGKQ